MSNSNKAATPDGGQFIKFEVMSGSRRVHCSISNETMDRALCLPPPMTPALRGRSFYRFRSLIHDAALLKLKDLPEGCSDTIELTPRDQRCLSN